jgi:four helix bundle protein
MGKIGRFEDLEVWKNAVKIGVLVYEIADKKPLSVDFKSRDQLIGAAISISNNIAEGFEYNNNKVFLRFLTYAKGSAGEVRSQAYILKQVNRITKEDYEILHQSLLNISSEIKGFMKYLSEFEKKKIDTTK